MSLHPSILCPVDFSEASRGALRYAAAIAEHYHATLMLLTVELLSEAVESTVGPRQISAHPQRLRQFVDETFHQQKPRLPHLDLEVSVGKPAPEILQLARARHADLIVMSTRGVTGARKLLFGSTTECVLRETEIPVLVTPAADTGPENLEQVKGMIRSVLVPVDFTAVTALQVRIARGLADALGASIVLAHVLEPLPAPAAQVGLPSDFDAERRIGAYTALRDVKGALSATVNCDLLVGCGDPAEEIAHLARTHDADLIVMGLHAAPGRGPRMGSVTYGVLCQTPSLVLALPPGITDKAARVPELAATARDDDEARKLLADAACYAAGKLSEVEARSHYLRKLHGEP